MTLQLHERVDSHWHAATTVVTTVDNGWLGKTPLGYSGPVLQYELFKHLLIVHLRVAGAGNQRRC